MEKFLNEVKSEYEHRTGELMVPYEEWSDGIKEAFENYNEMNDAIGFVDFILED